jgi:hypothetical protein
MEVRHMSVNVESNRAEDFIAGQIRMGIGKAHRNIDYGIGIHFDNELPFKIDGRFKEIRYRVFKADDRKYGVTVVKVMGLVNRQGLDVIDSFITYDTELTQNCSNFQCHLLRNSQ